MKRGQRWLTHWRRRYFGASIADNGCRSGKIPTPGEKGLSELLFLYLYTQDQCLGFTRLTHQTPKVDLNKIHYLEHYTWPHIHFHIYWATFSAGACAYISFLQEKLLHITPMLKIYPRLYRVKHLVTNEDYFSLTGKSFIWIMRRRGKVPKNLATSIQ